MSDDDYDPDNAPYEWEDPASANLGMKSWFEFSNETMANKPVHDDFLYSQGIHLIAARRNTGKSALTLGAAFAAARQMPFLGREYVGPVPFRFSDEPEPRWKTAVMFGEAPGNLRAQILAWEGHHGQRMRDGDVLFIPRFNLADHKRVREWATALEHEVVRNLVVDPLAAMIGGGNENDTGHMETVMAGIEILNAAVWPGLTLVAHHLNADGTRPRGAEVIQDRADVIYIAQKEGTTGIKLKRTKNRFGPVDATLRAQLYVAHDTYDEKVTSVVADKVSQRGVRQQIRLTGNAKAAWDTIETDSETVYTKAELQKLLVGIPRSSSYRTIDALVEAGKLTEVETDDGTAFIPQRAA